MIRTITLCRFSISMFALGVAVLPAAASATLIFGSNSVLDTSTSLSWQSLSTTAGAQLPDSGYVGSARVVSLDEILAFLQIGATQFSTSYRDPIAVPVDSDTYRLLDFFHSTRPSGVPCASFNAGSGQSCFDGWWKDSSGYNVLGFSYEPDATRPGFVDLFGTSTVGSYTQAQIDNDPSIFCKPNCNAFGLFTVVSVPVPGAGVMLATALVAMCYRRRGC